MKKINRSLTFRFFRDQAGRLRAECSEAGFTRPVESQQGKRYRIRKVFSCISKFMTDADKLRLQTAVEGDEIRIMI